MLRRRAPVLPNCWRRLLPDEKHFWAENRRADQLELVRISLFWPRGPRRFDLYQVSRAGVVDPGKAGEPAPADGFTRRAIHIAGWRLGDFRWVAQASGTGLLSE